jgi:hypothetical protein
MAFDIDGLFNFCIREINAFANNHQNELFYAFTIDAYLLCLNSEEAFEESLQQYRDEWECDNRAIATWDDLTKNDLWLSESLLESRARLIGLDLKDKDACLAVINQDRNEEREDGNPYFRDDEIISLRENTGNWKYQGFVEMTDSVGFDRDAYDVHYSLSDEEQKTSSYGKAMDEILRRLIEADAFACLKISSKFYANRVEHDY